MRPVATLRQRIARTLLTGSSAAESCVVVDVERVKGIEPSYEAWEAAVLPLNYTRVSEAILGAGNMPVDRFGAFCGDRAQPQQRGYRELRHDGPCDRRHETARPRIGQDQRR